MVLTILADDLTGACDTGTLFAGKAPVPVSVWPDPPRDAVVRVVDTESRTLDAEGARDRIRGAVCSSRAAGSPGRGERRGSGGHSGAPSQWFKKIDSTMRGRIGAEVDALMTALRVSGAVVCPAFPAQRRVVRERVLLVDGVPIGESSLARDPAFPVRTSSSSVVELLRGQLDRPLSWIPIDQVRAGSGPLAARLSRLAGTVAVADAETDDDLEALADGALAAEPSPLLVGAAGLARALASRLGLLAEHVPLPRTQRWLVVAGSRHTASRAQAARARQAGMTVVTSPDADERDAGVVAAQLAGDARRLLDRGGFDLVAVTGGETAVALYRELQATQIDLVGAPAPGLALGQLRARHHDGLTIVTKAGGFGDPDLFVTLARKAAA